MKWALTTDSCRYGFEVIWAHGEAGGAVEGTELGLMYSAAETETRLYFLCCPITAGQCFDVREDISEFITWYLFTR